MLPNWWGGPPGPRGSPWTRCSLEGSKACITAAGRRGRRPRSRGTAPPYAGDAPVAYLSGIGRKRLPHLLRDALEA